jgi:hypothetical protein
MGGESTGKRVPVSKFLNIMGGDGGFGGNPLPPRRIPLFLGSVAVGKLIESIENWRNIDRVLRGIYWSSNPHLTGKNYGEMGGG